MPFVVIQGHGSSLIRREILIYRLRCFETNQPLAGYLEVKHPRQLYMNKGLSCF